MKKLSFKQVKPEHTFSCPKNINTKLEDLLKLQNEILLKDIAKKHGWDYLNLCKKYLLIKDYIE